MVNPGIYSAIIKDNTDKLGMGRVRVYIPEFGGDPTDENNWYLVSYMSPHGGQTNPYHNKKGGKKEKESQDSYGTWMTGYHPENEVVISFTSNDAASGMIMGAMFQQNMTHSMGGYALAKTTQGTTEPTVEYNKRDEDINPRKPERPRYERLYRQLMEQGIINDHLRTNATTSPHRDLVPQFLSMKTPRGTTFVIDDGKIDPNSGAGVNTRQYARQPGGGTSMIRIRTEGGAQTIINDDCGFIHFMSSNGNSWAQLSDNGVAYFTEGSIAMRVEGSYNARIDGDYSSETLGPTSFKIAGDTNITTDGGFNLRDQGDGIKLTTDGNYGAKSEGDSIHDSEVALFYKSGGNIVKRAANILKNTAAGPQSKTTTELQTGKVMDIFQASGTPNPNQPVNEPTIRQESVQQETTLPDGGLVTHEPWPGQGQACGKPDSPSEETEPEVEEAVENGQFTESFKGVSPDKLNQLNDYLISEGFDTEQRAAIIGSFVQESGLNPTILGDSGRSLGLAQWNGSRRAELYQFAAENGMNPHSLDTQMRFFSAEITPGSGYGSSLEKRAGETLRSATTVDQAMYGMKQYERYGVAGARYTNAQQIYDLIR